MSTYNGVTDLLWLVTKNDDEISDYLGDVSVDQFRKDVEELLKKSVDSEPIKQAIELLKKYL